MELVAARTADDVDDAAHRPAELGAVAGGRDLDLLHLLHDHRLGLVAAVDVVDVRAVDVEHVLAAGRAVDREAALVAFILDAGHRAQQPVEVAVARQLHEHFLGHDAALGGALDVDQRALADDRDLLLERADLESDVQGDGLLELQEDRFALVGLEPLEREGEGVLTGRQGEQAVGPCRVGDRGGRADQPGAGRFDGDAGERRALFIDNLADEPARRNLGGREGAGQGHCEEQDKALLHSHKLITPFLKKLHSLGRKLEGSPPGQAPFLWTCSRFHLLHMSNLKLGKSLGQTYNLYQGP